MRKVVRAIPYYLHHLWLIVGAITLYEFVQLIRLAGLNRTSLANNRRFLVTIETSNETSTLALFLTLTTLLILRRRLKRGVIRRLGVRWQRVVFGLAMPIAVPFFWMRDVERLANLPRSATVSKETVRTQTPKKSTLLWLLLIFSLAQVSSRLNRALLGINYVTEGTAVLDDPLRYALKWIEPAKITGALDEYSKYIWLGAVANCVVLAAFSVVSWLQLQRLTRMSMRALA